MRVCRLAVALCATALALGARAAAPAVPFTFTAGSAAKASEVNANFAAMATAIEAASVSATAASGAAAAAAARLPTGSILPYAGTTAPAGFVFCDGAALSRTGEAADLFGVIGTTYGPGDGATTFRVPNLRSRFPLGAGEGHALASAGGAERYALTEGQLPGHRHDASTGPQSAKHVHEVAKLTGDSFNDAPVNRFLAIGAKDQFVNDNVTFTAEEITQHGHWVDVQPTGGGAPHDSMPPFLVVNWIIKL